MTIIDGTNFIRITESNSKIHFIGKHNMGLSTISVMGNEVWFRLPWDGISNNPLILKCNYQSTTVDGVQYASAILLAEAIIALV
jgi:hypothetical protein